MSTDGGSGIGTFRQTTRRASLSLLVLCFAASAPAAMWPSAWGLFVALNLAAGVLVAILWWRGSFTTRQVLAFALIFRLAYLWLPPVLSDDSFRYIWDGLVQLEGVNPYAFVPAAAELSGLHSEPIFTALNSASYYTVYPPLSQLVFLTGAVFYAAGWEVSFYVIKLLFAGAEVGVLLLLAKHVTPRRLVLYAWNPLVVLVAAGQPHTESLAALLLVATWILADRKRGGWASVMLAAAGLVKLYPFVLFPLLWRRFGWRSVWPGFVAGAAVSIPYYHPQAVVHIVDSLDLYVRSFEFNAGLYYGVKELYLIATGADWSKQIGPALRWLFLAALPVVYVVDWCMKLSFRRAVVAILALFFLFSTTVHPWYLLPVLALVTPADRPSWHWIWLGILSIGTYLLYVDGSYWIWVILGWAGWGVLALNRHLDDALQPLMRLRAARKADLLAPYVGSSGRAEVLDLGAGEGYVGQEMAERLGADVVLADVRDMNRTDLPLNVYDGRNLPFDDGRFDAVLLVYVLHHAEQSGQVLDEAVRVCRGRILILESIYSGRLSRMFLVLADRAANAMRSGGAWHTWNEPLHFKTFDEWLVLFRGRGYVVEHAEDLGGRLHRRSLFVLQPPER